MSVISGVQSEPRLRIGELASRSAVSVEALRYYERRGLLFPIGRRASGYREYPDDAVRVVRFIKRAQALGFSIAEIHDLVRLRERAWSGDAPRQLRQAAASKVGEIDRRVRQLNALRGALAELITACDTACPVCSAADDDARTTGRRDLQPTRATGTVVALPCPLIEALDTDEEPEESAAHVERDRRLNNPSHTKRRGARRISPVRDEVPTSRRTR